MRELAGRAGVLATGLALGACDWLVPTPEPVAELPGPAPIARIEVVEVPIASRREVPQRFTSAPFVALTRIDAYAPRSSEPWPPLTSKHGDVHGIIWDAPVFVGPQHYWHGAWPWLVQPRDLEPMAQGMHVQVDGPGGRILGLFGDQLVLARGRERGETRVEIHLALVDEPDAPWHLCTLEWPRWAVESELGVWYQTVGPVLVDDEIVVLGEHGLVRASVLDCGLEAVPTEHEPRALTPSDDRVAWRRQEDGQGRWSVALDDFERVLHLPYTGLADWAGDSLIIEDEGQLLRWTEDEVVVLEFPGSAKPTRDRRWRAGGEALWIYEPGQPLWRIDGEGFVGLDLDLDWPNQARAQAGVLIWAIAGPDRMEVFSTWPGSGLGLDRGSYSQVLAPAR